eukprot:6755533-Prymnesium_polylepis.1
MRMSNRDTLARVLALATRHSPSPIRAAPAALCPRRALSLPCSAARPPWPPLCLRLSLRLDACTTRPRDPPSPS